ncbi:hypothetical protein FBY39_0921 [Microbacterium sp. SLBN-146]|nr:hypothetical protein FBY39_0921 [Microbacterium sp. SLBN-146]
MHRISSSLRCRTTAIAVGFALAGSLVVFPPSAASAAQVPAALAVKAAGCSLGVQYSSGPWYWWISALYGAKVYNCGSVKRRIEFILRGGARRGLCLAVAPGKEVHDQATTAFGGYRFC